MDDASLPIEVCENIIDHCHLPKDDRLWMSAFRESYGALRACSLVCSAWLPRSRRNLLCEVRLGSFDHADLLSRFLAKKPHLTELVTAIYIVETKYVPFVRFALPGLLPNCRRLATSGGDPAWNWSKTYPPGYPKSISGFRELSELVLTIDGLSAPELFHIIWSLPLLSSLVLVQNQGSRRIERFGGRFREKLMARCKLESCHELKRLAFHTSAFSNLLSLENFPPRGCFGQSVTHLELIMRTNPSKSGSFLECIGDFPQLHSVTIDEQPFPVIFANAFEILPHLQSGRQLRKITLLQWARRSLVDKFVYVHYGHTRSVFLDILCGPEMQSALQRFPCLQLLHLRIEESDNEHTNQWWIEEISNRLPALGKILQMDVTVCAQASRSDKYEHSYSYLWDPKGLAQFEERVQREQALQAIPDTNTPPS